MKEVTSILKQTTLFGKLDAETLREVATHAAEYHLNRDAFLFVAGEECRGLFVVASGAVRAFSTGADGREQTIFVIRAPATVGEVPVFDGGVHLTTVIAEEETRLFFIKKAYIRALCLKSPPFAMKVLKVLGQQVRSLSALVEELTLREVGERLVYFLLSEADRAGEVKTGEIYLKLNLTHSQIAARIGTVREVVSRNLTHLKSKGFIRAQNRQLIIADRAKLLNFAQKRKK
jgi:CRP/FNR family cyclic AMP-dependent transcriptional regulator